MKSSSSLCFLFLLCASALFPLACGGKAKSAPKAAPACLEQKVTVDKGGSNAEIPHCMKACNLDEHCTVVNTSCPGCCGYQAIGLNYEDHYATQKAPLCKKYTGLVCGCDERAPEARCAGHVCELITE